MTNKEIAKILYEISEYLAMDDVAFKPRAYEKAAISIESLEKDVSEIYKKEGLRGLEKIPAIGEGIAKRIEELIKTGKSKYYQQLKKKMPVELDELTVVEGIGPKMVKKLYKELKIKNLKQLEKAAKAGKIRHLRDFGEKTEQNILQGIDFLRKTGDRFLLGLIMPDVRRIEERIRRLPGVKKAVVAGSIRRMKETIGDGDLLVVVSSPLVAERVSDFFINMPEVRHVYSHGPTKSSVRLKNNMDFDIRVVPEQSFGAALQYFTGSKAHNIKLRKIAMKRGLKLNEYGLFSLKSKLQKTNNKQILNTKFQTEEDIYSALGLQYMEPEIREDAGEIEAAQKNKLPKVIGYNDLKGDLQMHTKWSDGVNTIEQMAEKAMEMNLEYITITDHIRGTMDRVDGKELFAQGREIDRINSKFEIRNVGSRTSNIFRILKGAEVDILNDGRLFMKDEILKKLDIVGAAVHSSFKMPKQKMTERIIRAMKNPNVDILFHPTGRLIGTRPPYEIDIEKIIRVAKETKTILEIDAYFNRLDLKDEYARIAKEAGVKLAINSDSHSVQHFKYLELGISQARRGWVEKKDVINAWSLEKMLKMLK